MRSDTVGCVAPIDATMSLCEMLFPLPAQSATRTYVRLIPMNRPCSYEHHILLGGAMYIM